MTATRYARRILVPVLDGDITSATFARARAATAHSDARLIILHVTPAAADDRPAERQEPGTTPRWRRLAQELPADRVFVDAVAGDPAAVIVTQAARFACDLVLDDRQPRQATPRPTPWRRRDPSGLAPSPMPYLEG
jgi:nucleotide-binding universal stress UspA family protein